MIDPIDALKDKMVMVAKILQHQGVLDGYGHLSARLADGRLLSTPHMPPGKVALRDLMIIDADGKYKLKARASPTARHRCTRRSTKHGTMSNAFFMTTPMS